MQRTNSIECLRTSVGLTDGLLPVLQHSQTMSYREAGRSSRGTSLTAVRGLISTSHCTTTTTMQCHESEHHVTILQLTLHRTRSSKLAGGAEVLTQCRCKKSLPPQRCRHFLQRTLQTNKHQHVLISSILQSHQEEIVKM